MRKLLQKLAIILLAVSCVVGASACDGLGGGGNGGGGYQPVDVALDPNTEAHLIAVVDVDSFEKKLLEDAAKGFQTHFPNVSIEVIQNGDVISYIRSGDQVDIMSVIGENVSFFASQGVLTELDPYLEAQEFDTSKYFPSMMDLGKDTVSKKQYMMPRDYSRIVLFYNKDLFDRLNVSYPVDTEESPWTWEAFLAKCEEIKTAMAAGGADYKNYVPVEGSMSYDILNWGIVSSYGVDCLLKDDFTLVDKGSPTYANWQKGMTAARDLIKYGYSLDSDNYSPSHFQTGVAAMAFGVAPAMQGFNLGQINYDVISFPAIGNTPKAPSGTSGYAIANGSGNKNIAWAFLNYLMSEEGQTVLTTGTGLVPVLTALAEDKNAAWRGMKNGKGNDINIDALLSYSERDVIADWFGNLPALARSPYKGFYNNFLKLVCDGKKSFEQGYTLLAQNIDQIKRDYPEYFV